MRSEFGISAREALGYGDTPAWEVDVLMGQLARREQAAERAQASAEAKAENARKAASS